MRLKEFIIDESHRCGVGIGAIYMRVLRGYYPNLKLERKNKRVIFVKGNHESKRVN